MLAFFIIFHGLCCRSPDNGGAVGDTVCMRCTVARHVVELFWGIYPFKVVLSGRHWHSIILFYFPLKYRYLKFIAFDATVMVVFRFSGTVFSLTWIV